MSSITFQESGSDATGDLSFYSATVGTVASDNTVSHTGPRSIKLSTGSPAANAQISAYGVLADAGRRINFWFRISALPAANINLCILNDSSGLGVCSYNLLTNGKIRIVPTGATIVDSTLAVVPNTWIRIVMSYTVTNTTTFKFVLFMDGVLQATATVGTLTRTGIDRPLFCINSGAGANVNGWFDDIYIDDGSDYTDPGDIRITNKRPAANNTNNFDTAVGSNPANRWLNVREVPLSETNGWQHAAATDVQENYTLQASAVGEANVTDQSLGIVGRCAWIWAKRTGAAGTGTSKIMDNGTETAITLTTTAALFTVLTATASYPSDVAGIGIRSTSNTDDTFLYECGMLIAYTQRPRYLLC